MRKSAIFLLLVLAGCASIPPDAPLPERERLLMHALVQRNVPTLNQLLTDDFTCEVQADRALNIAPAVMRFTLCTGYGHRRPESSLTKEHDLTRAAVIRSLDVQESAEAATVVMEQSYFGWVPYDGSFERRSRVTDTWVRRDGHWRIARRVTAPI
jgi:hypothetical protein